MATTSEPRVTITVPAGYLEDVRDALVSLLSFDAGQNDAFREERDRQLAVVRHDTELLDRLPASGEAQLRGDRHTLLYMLEEMGRLLSERLEEQFTYAPPDMPAISQLVDRLRWSVITHGEAVA